MNKVARSFLKRAKSEESRWLALSLGFHVLAAIFSIGYYDVDEQFQVLEFLNFRLGRSPASQLAWEYGERTRSWLQPMFYEAFVRAMRACGIASPASWAMGLRLVSALIGWSALAMLCRYARATLPQPRSLGVHRLSAVLFCIPYLHARTSGENLGGSFLAIGALTYLLAARERATSISRATLLEAGACLGLAFGFRYQVGLMGAALLAWATVVQKQRPSALGWMAVGATSVVALNLGLDAWGYGRFGFTPIRYFDSQILKGVAAGFGVQPWWFLLQQSVQTVPPLTATLAAATALFWVRFPASPFTWVTAPFVLLHFFVGHKELRFLFPVACFLPWFAVEAVRGWPELKPLRKAWAFVNATVLAVATLKPSTAFPRIWDAIYERRAEIRELHYFGRSPYEVVGLQANFYKPDGLTLVAHPTREALLASKPRWAFHTDYSLPGCRLEASAFPDWMRALEGLPGPGRFAYKGSLFRCDE